MFLSQARMSWILTEGTNLIVGVRKWFKEQSNMTETTKKRMSGGICYKLRANVTPISSDIMAIFL